MNTGMFFGQAEANGLYSLAKEGIAYAIVIFIFITAVMIIKDYPNWQEKANAHQVKLKEMENSNEKEIALIFDRAMNKQTEVIDALKTQVEKSGSNNEKMLAGMIEILKRMDSRCESHGRKLEQMAIKL